MTSRHEDIHKAIAREIALGESGRVPRMVTAKRIYEMVRKDNNDAR